MPLFFIAAGYFFSRKYLSDPWTFISRRVKGLYVPFVTWAVIFLLLHNLWFRIGLLNEVYGNATGGVTHPYTEGDFWYRLVCIFTNMSGYDEFMAGAFWFFRGLLLASVLFLLLYKLLSYPRTLFTKRQLIDDIWDLDSDVDEHTVEVYISRLREKFRDNRDFELRTIRGFGYMGMPREDGNAEN